MNSDDDQRRATGQLNVAMKAMQAIDVAELPAGLIERTLPAMLERSRFRRWRRLVLRGAAAAMVALLCTAALMTLTKPSQALAEVAERVGATKTVRAIIVDPHEGGKLLVSGTRTRFEGSGSVVIADAASHQEVMLDAKSKMAYKMPDGPSRALDFYGIFRELAAAASTPIEDYVDKAGRHFPGLRGRSAIEIGGDGPWKIDAKVWTDPGTKLPIRLEIRPVDNENDDWVALIEQIEFDVPLDEALFDMTIPAGYTVLGDSAEELKPALSAKEAAKLTIVPGVGIGAVKFGMTRQQIVAILGEPEFTLHGAYLEYSSLGLELLLSPRPDQLGTITANPFHAAWNAHKHRDFAGQTDKGIRIGSSERQIRDAYGEPDPPNPKSRAQVANYEKLGLQFGLLDDKVTAIRFYAR